MRRTRPILCSQCHAGYLTRVSRRTCVCSACGSEFTRNKYPKQNPRGGNGRARVQRGGLLPKTVAEKLPPLYSQEKMGEKAVVLVKFFLPGTNWKWYATEYDPKERLFFGLVHGYEDELGYFSLDELEGGTFDMSMIGPFGTIKIPVRVERDVNWKPKTLGEIRAELEQGRAL